MATELYRLKEQGAAGKTWVEVEESIIAACRKMGRWTMNETLESHPLAETGRNHACPRCGKKFRIMRQSQRGKLRSRLGRIFYNRPYGTCDRCKISGAPMDWELGFSEENVSIGLLERVCHASVVGRSFDDAHEIVTMHDMVDLSTKQIRVLAEGEGHRLAQQRDQQVTAYRQHKLKLNTEQSPELLVVCADGGRVQTREGFAQRGSRQRREEAGEVEEQRDAADAAEQSKRKEHWKEDKVGTVYDAVAQPHMEAAYGKYQGAKAKIKTYVASMESWKSFGWMLRLEAELRGYPKAKTRLFLADGAKSIREMKDLHFQETTFILDWAHAAEHVATCAKALFGEGTDKTKGWYKEHRDMLWNGKRDELIEELQKHSQRLGEPEKGEPDTSPRRVLYQNAYSYFPNNRDAIDYPSFRDKEWPIGSGVAEGSVKQFAKRLKGSEKFWNRGGLDPDLDILGPERPQTGAEEMLALCALYYSEDGRWQRHWHQRGEPVRWK